MSNLFKKLLQSVVEWVRGLVWRVKQSWATWEKRAIMMYQSGHLPSINKRGFVTLLFSYYFMKMAVSCPRDFINNEWIKMYVEMRPHGYPVHYQEALGGC